MNIAKVLKSASFGYLLLASPQEVYGDIPSISFKDGNNAGGIIDPIQDFCPIDNLSFTYSNFDSRLQEDYFSTRDVVDFSLAFEPSDANQDSWSGSLSSFVFHIYQTTTDRLFGRRNPNLLIEAVLEGDLPRVQKLIQAGADVNHPNKHGQTALFKAIDKDDLAIVQALIKAGADINYSSIFDSETSALFKAIDKDDLAIVQALIKAGANVNCLNSYGESALIVAIKTGKWGIARALIKAGADVNSFNRYGKLALILAIEQNKLDMVQTLIKAGADVNCLSKFKASPLRFAFLDDNPDIVQALIKAGAKITSSDYYIAMNFAMKKNDLNILQKVIEAEHFDSSAATYFMRSAIMYDRIEIVKALIKAGADVNFIFSLFAPGILFIETPLVLARREENSEIVQVLIETGADERLDEINLYAEKFMLLKLIGHAFEFNLTVPFQDKDLELEGMQISEQNEIPEQMRIDTFYETFYDITNAFFKELKVEQNFDTKRILSALTKPVWGKKNSSQVFPDIAMDTIEQSDGTIIIHWEGWRHAIDIIFSDNYLVICNKGARSDGAHQIEAYKIDRESFANIENIFKDLERQAKDLTLEDKYNFSIIYNNLPKAFQGKKDWVCEALSSLVTTKQVVGNCAWESPKTSLEALMGLDYLLKHLHLENEDGSVVQEHLDRDVHQIMEQWIKSAKEYLLANYERFHEDHPEIEIDEELYQKAKAALSV